MTDQDRWRSMTTAPKDGTRILVTVAPSEQGPAAVDVAYWAGGDEHDVEGWRAADSHPGAVITYADPEIKCWMPLPGAEDGRPSAWEGSDEHELDGSGI